MDGTSRIDELEQKFIENPRRYFAPLANEYRKAGNPHQAIAICRAHLGQLPGHMSGQIVYGQALFEGGEFEQARTVFENALAMDRENLVALRHLGDLAHRDGETAAARQWYAKILDVDPKDAAVIALVNEIDAAAEAQPSATNTEQQPAEDQQAAEEKGETAAADEPVVATAPESDPFHSEEEDKLISEELGFPVPPPQAFVTETMAELYLAQGFRDRAVNVYRKLVSMRPEDARLRSRLADLEGVAGEAPPPSVEAGVQSRAEPEPEVAPDSSPQREESPATEPARVDPAPVDPEPPEQVPFEPERVEVPAEEGGSVQSAGEEHSAAHADVLAPSMTVRDFFATLGRRKPGSRANGSSANGADRNARDAFGSAEASSADSIAAANLAGAFGPPPGASPSGGSQGRESEEDVASFRAWLDGLTQ